MSGFSRNNSTAHVHWFGDPDQVAHDALRDWLAAHCGSTFLGDPAHFSTQIQGNLGEAIALCVGLWHDYKKSFFAFTANAHDPIQPISRPGVDIIWLFFGDVASRDLALLQEVKTTCDANLRLATDLIDDYRKLFGTDLNLTLRSRLDSKKTKVELEQQRPELCPRITELAGQSPVTSPKIMLLPTLVHDTSVDSTAKMLVVRTALVGAGWITTSVISWSITLDGLRERLIRLAGGLH